MRVSISCFQSLCNQLAVFVEFIFKEMIGPGEHIHSNACTQLHHRFVNIRQSFTRTLQVKTGSNRPAADLTNSPYSIDELWNEAPLRFHQLSEYQFSDSGDILIVQIFHQVPVARLHIFEVKSCGNGLPNIVQCSFSVFDQLLFVCGRQRFPGSPVTVCGKLLIQFLHCKVLRQLLFAVHTSTASSVPIVRKWT